MDFYSGAKLLTVQPSAAPPIISLGLSFMCALLREPACFLLVDLQYSCWTDFRSLQVQQRSLFGDAACDRHLANIEHSGWLVVEEFLFTVSAVFEQVFEGFVVRVYHVGEEPVIFRDIV